MCWFTTKDTKNCFLFWNSELVQLKQCAQHDLHNFHAIFPHDPPPPRKTSGANLDTLSIKQFFSPKATWKLQEPFTDNSLLNSFPMLKRLCQNEMLKLNDRFTSNIYHQAFRKKALIFSVRNCLTSSISSPLLASLCRLTHGTMPGVHLRKQGGGVTDLESSSGIHTLTHL